MRRRVPDDPAVPTPVEKKSFWTKRRPVRLSALSSGISSHQGLFRARGGRITVPEHDESEDVVWLWEPFEPARCPLDRLALEARYRLDARIEPGDGEIIRGEGGLEAIEKIASLEADAEKRLSIPSTPGRTFFRTTRDKRAPTRQPTLKSVSRNCTVHLCEKSWRAARAPTVLEYRESIERQSRHACEWTPAERHGVSLVFGLLEGARLPAGVERHRRAHPETSARSSQPCLTFMESHEGPELTSLSPRFVSRFVIDSRFTCRTPVPRFVAPPCLANETAEKTATSRTMPKVARSLPPFRS
ncbi:hypothetical protein KM043_004041 [Ampulex compressa]|nr:hypothetical protein KM043_004041 [Ampulex compressa]